MATAWGRLSFSWVLIVLSAVTLTGVAALRLAGAGVYALAFLVVPIGAGGWYLYENREHPPLDLSRRPVSPPRAGAPPAGGSAPPATGPDPADPNGPPIEPWGPMPSPDEPFDDPVELADRLDRAGPTPEPATEPAPESPPSG